MGRVAPKTIPSTKREIEAELPYHSMDEETRKKLQVVRSYVPRYLFRAWRNTLPYVSGGFLDLNSTDAIVPLAFRAGRGHSSVYDMKKDELLEMVLKHLEYDKDFFTGFSSWTASLTCAMMFFGSDSTDVYISIIDTKAMQHQNEIFFVPNLSLLTNRANTKRKMEIMHHEYLVHGKVCGAFHRAVRLDQFIHAGFDIQSLATTGANSNKPEPTQVTVSEVQNARQVANHYGYHFAIPVALALLSLQARDSDLFLREDSTEFGYILAGLENFHVPQSWGNDDTIMGDTVYIGTYQDVRQFIHLMRAAVRHEARIRCQHYGTPNADANRLKRDGSSKQDQPTNSSFEAGNSTSAPIDRATPSTLNPPQRKWFIRFNKGKAKVVQRDCQTGLQWPVTRSVARVVKTGTSRALLKINTAAMHRAMQRLVIDMNRDGKNEKDIDTEMVEE